MNDKKIFALIADEIATGKVDDTLWAQALEQCGQDLDRAKAQYIRSRKAQLSKQSRRGSEAATPRQSADKAAATEIQRIRGELKRLLRQSGHGSLYRTLELAPDCSNADLAARIDAVQAGLRRGEGGAELRYAVEILGDARQREAYDRKLLSQLQPKPAAAAATESAPQAGDDAGSLRSRIYVAIAVIFGAIAIAYVFYQRGQADLIARSEEQATALHRAYQAQQQGQRNSVRMHNANPALSGGRATSGADTGARYRQRAETREQERAIREIKARDRQLKERQQARQQQIEANRRNAELRRKQAAERATDDAHRKQRYWACMNAALEAMDAADAKRSCGPVP